MARQNPGLQYYIDNHREASVLIEAYLQKQIPRCNLDANLRLQSTIVSGMVVIYDIPPSGKDLEDDIKWQFDRDTGDFKIYHEVDKQGQRKMDGFSKKTSTVTNYNIALVYYYRSEDKDLEQFSVPSTVFAELEPIFIVSLKFCE